jgi:hypothetical protein
MPSGPLSLKSFALEDDGFKDLLMDGKAGTPDEDPVLTSFRANEGGLEGLQ